MNVAKKAGVRKPFCVVKIVAKDGQSGGNGRDAAKRNAWVCCEAVEAYRKMDKAGSLREHPRIKPEGNKRKNEHQRFLSARMEDGGFLSGGWVKLKHLQLNNYAMLEPKNR